MSLLRTILTEDDANKVWCPLRIAFGVVLLNGLVLANIAVLLKDQPFDPLAYGTAFGALLTGAGAAIFFNGRSDPPKGTSA
jgi:hypothetical protein